jgi:N-acetylmuramoyl-L-alanine amidase
MHGVPHPQRPGDEEVPVSLPRRFLRLRLMVPTILVIGLATLLRPSTQLAADNFIFYLPSGHHMIPFASSGGAKYLPVIQVLNLLGKVEGIQEKKTSVRIFFNSTPIELHAAATKIQIANSNYDLQQPVYFVDGKWMVPVDFLTTALSPLAHLAVEYQQGTNRIFIGDVKPASFTVRLDPLANGARLAIQFTDKVSVHTTSSNGNWVMFLGDRPVEPMEPSYHFQNPYISNLQFDDEDGLPKLVLTPGSSGMNFLPVLADGGKILMADVVQASPSSPGSPQQPAPAQPVPGQPTPPGSPESPSATLGPPLPVVVLDPAHGGPDSGSHSNDGVLEKDLMVQYVLRVRIALLATNKYRVVLTRTGDMNITAEQRALAANTSNAIYFLSFHAGDLGSSSPRIAVFTFQPPSAPDAASGLAATPTVVPASPKKSSAFVPWGQVQEARLGQSQQLAQALQQQLASISGVDVRLPATAPLRSLRSVNAPAAAIELGRLAPDASAALLTDVAFQQKVATAVVQALSSFEKGGQ